MPLASGSSEASISANIAELIRSGHPPKQAEAAAYRMARGDAADIGRAAGIMLLTADGEVLLLKRGDGGAHPGEWCFPGGTTEGTETAEDTAKRETIEELGFLPDGERIVLTRSVNNPEIAAQLAPEAGLPPTDAMVIPGTPVEYTTFLQRVPERFEPTLNGEHTGFAWCKPDAPPEPLHPGCRIALARLTMNELDIARAMAAGDLSSPQQYHNVVLFDIRLTGTGLAYRAGRDEHVWRDASIYCNDEFLARCNGLPVIWVHPKKSLLSSKEFADRIIGTAFLPYIKNDEIWAIVKIYDGSAIEEMAKGELSTSPGAMLGGVEDTKLKLEDGSVLLIEGKPLVWDHIAVVSAGVWDRDGGPTGIRTDSAKDRTMAEETEAEKKAREEKERSDAANINMKLVDALDSMGKRMDAMEKDRKDEKEAAEKEKADAARRDAVSKRDAEHEEWKKEDAAFCADEDEREKAECDAMVKDGMGEEEATDKARKDRRGRMDAHRKDAKAEQDRKDAERARDDAARHDSAATIAKAVDAALKARQRPETDAAAIADEQSRADAVHMAFGTRAPQPMMGETTADYQLRMAKGFQKHSKRWKDTNLAVLPSDARGIVVADIYADAVAASRDTDDLPYGTLIPIQRTNRETGHIITEFRGRGTFIGMLKPDSLRVTKFKTPEKGA